MDRKVQLEIVHEGLETLKKNESQYNQTKELAKKVFGKYPQINKDKELVSLVVYSVGVVGKEITEEVIDRYFKLRQKKFENKNELLEGTTKAQGEENFNLLFLMLYGEVQKASLSHKVYVLTRTDIRKDVEFANDKPDETGNLPKHRTMNVSLWDIDTKKIVNLFVVDNQIDTHSKLEQGKTYRMQIGNYNADKNRWYPSNEPQIVPLEDFELDEEELAVYLMKNYSIARTPYDDVIVDEKEHPGKRHVLRASYVKMPGYISLLTEDQEIVMMYYSKLTSNALDQDGEAVILGTLRKSKPVEGQPQIADYIIFPDVVINLYNIGNDDNPHTGSGDTKVESEDPTDLL